MELLHYTFCDAYTIQIGSTDISCSWEKFKVRAREAAPDKYCSYRFASGGELKVYGASKDLECISEDQWNTARPVIFEDHKYSIVISVKDAISKPCIIHPNKEVEAMFNLIKLDGGVYVLSGSIDFLNQPGHFSLEFSYTNKLGESIKHPLAFDVLSPKLDTKQDLNVIIQEIRNEFGDLVFRYLSLTFQQFEIGREANNDLIWLSVFKQIIEGYVRAVRYVLHQPHNKVHSIEEYRRAERIKEWNPYIAERFENDRKEDAQRAYRNFYRTERVESTLDTRENRFVKYTLIRINERLQRLLGKLTEETSDNEIAFLKARYAEIEALRRNSFFSGIGHFEGLQQQSMVLQQRSGYAQVYRYWIMLQNGLDLIQGSTSVGVQPIWKLYELWCFLKVKQLVCKVLGIDTQNKEHIKKYIHEDTKNAFDIFNGGSLSGSISYVNPKNEDLIEIGYQYSFNRGISHSKDSDSETLIEKNQMRSATTEQKPDIVMHIYKKNQDITLTYLYDAKYRVKGDDDAEHSAEVMDEPVAETLDAMHHYRDAIYYGRKGDKQFSKEIIGGYILFPGRMNEKEMVERIRTGEGRIPYFLRSIDEVNIGAYPLLPNEDSGILLENHLRKVLLEDTVIEQIKDSVPQRGLFYTDTEPKNVESKNIFTATVNKDDSQIESFLDHKAKKYIMETNPSVNILEAKFLMPMVKGRIDGYYQIKGLTIEDGKMCFKLGEYYPLGETWINVYPQMRHGELITYNHMLRLYTEMKN